MCESRAYTIPFPSQFQPGKDTPLTENQRQLADAYELASAQEECQRLFGCKPPTETNHNIGSIGSQQAYNS